MAEIRLTEEQQAVVDERGCSVLVSAGAGSGKTFVLVRRLMSFIDPPEGSNVRPADITDFLIITYTRAAAGELKTKISEELSKAVAEETKRSSLYSPQERRTGRGRLEHLRRQTALISRAHIGTIHSFCVDTIREFGTAENIRPDFKVIEDERADKLKAAAMLDILEERYAEPESYPGFTDLTETYGSGRDDRALEELILTVDSKLQSHAFPDAWAASQREVMSVEYDDPARTPWGRVIMEHYSARVNALYTDIMKAVAELDDCDETIRSKFISAAEESVETIRSCAYALDSDMGGSWEKAGKYVFPGFPRWPTAKNNPCKDVTDKIKELRNKFKAMAEKIQSAFTGDPEEILEDQRSTATALSALLDAAEDFRKRYTEAKLKNSLLDYSDLEHVAARLLCSREGTPTDIARSVSKRFTEIMVDEYQDVSRVQDAIFSAVSKDGNNLFFVGDIKQSIYRFRLADPEIFNEKYTSRPDWRAAEGNEPRRIPLRENFRSRKEIINAVNSIFTCCMGKELGDVDYSQSDQQLKFGAVKYTGNEPVPELIIYTPDADNDSADPQESRDALSRAPAQDSRDEEAQEASLLEAEAALVAEKIQSIVADPACPIPHAGLELPAAETRYSYSDVAILLRSTKKAETVFRRALEARDIPVTSSSGADLLAEREITWLVNMLSIIDNPRKDVQLLSVLRSPISPFTPDELAAIRAGDTQGDYWNSILSASETDEKCARFIEKLTALREDSSQISMSELVWHLICDNSLPAICSAMPEGERKKQHLLDFVELTGKYEAQGYVGLHRFVGWLERLASSEKKMPCSTSGSGGVTIMTVHKSKGLEFPVVFLCNTGKRFNQMDTRSSVLVHPELGLGGRVVDRKERVSYPSIAHRAITLKMSEETVSEEMRLLYVALTRAKERLYMTACVKNAEKKVDEAEGMDLSRTSLAEKSSYLDWLLAAYVNDRGEHFTLTVRTYNPAAVSEYGLLSTSGETEPLADSLVSGNYGDRLRRNLSYIYPHASAVDLPSKITATELKGNEDPDAEAYMLPGSGTHDPAPGPVFRIPNPEPENRKATATERGTATHLLLQHIDLNRTGSLQEIEQEIERLKNREFMTERDAELAERKTVERFFRSDIGRRMRQADNLRREFRFSLLCNAEDITGEGGEEQILLQGVVDCCIEEDDGLVIVDYKTDRVFTSDEVRERAENYSGQLRAYSMAMSRIFGKKVKECVLYFLTPGKEVIFRDK